MFNALRFIVKAGMQWRMMPNDQRVLLRLARGRAPQSTAVIFDVRTMLSSSKSGRRAGYDDHKRKKGSKVLVALDTVGHVLALQMTPANDQ